MTKNPNELKYRNAVNHNSLFRISNSDFQKWLKLNNFTDDFLTAIYRLEGLNDYEELYDLAWDYSIPIIIIKFYYNEIHT